MKRYYSLILFTLIIALVGCAATPAAESPAANLAPTTAPLTPTSAAISTKAAPDDSLPKAGPSLPEGVVIRPIDDIVDAELLVTNFANDGSATLPIETKIPVACTLVYGLTPEFGSLTLDQDMAGGTHSSHNPLLSNLQPESKYYFRVQGVDDNGTLYLSEVMSFTTPPPDDSPVENLASPEMGAEIIGYSSAFGNAGVSESWGAGSAFDGSPNTAWSSAGDGNNAWVEVALAKPAHIERIEFQTRSMSDGTAIALKFTITTNSGEVFGPFTLPDASSPYSFDVSIDAKSLRFDLIDTTGGNTGATEIAVYGSFAESAAQTTPPPEKPDDKANANVIFVKAAQNGEQSWTFAVTVKHPDTGWDDYADGWDVVLPDGSVVKPNPNDPFTRLLLHPHVDEQPFTRSQRNIKIPADINTVTVRAHDLLAGWGGAEIIVDLSQEKGEGFEVTK